MNSRSKKKNIKNKSGMLILYILVLAIFICLEINFLSHYESLLKTCEIIEPNAQAFRNLDISDEVLEILWKDSNKNRNKFIEKITMNMLLNNFMVLKKKQIIQSNWYLWDKLVPDLLYETYYHKYEILFKDLGYFPVAKDLSFGETLSFDNSWMSSRTYGGKRHHEGTDIMADNNIKEYFPVVSVSDGTVEQKGWLEMGGYRIGIRSTSGAYFYYAHLDSYAPNLEIGDTILAGNLVGMMGNTGYSKVEGTCDKFQVHLHFGIYLYEGEEEISVNPYWVLKYLEPNEANIKKTS